MAAGARTLADAFGDRVVLGIGVGHEYSTEARGYAWERPLTRMRAYLDRMDEAPWSAPGSVVGVRRLLAALGDGMLGLSAERALGAHTYFVPVAHTRHAREVLGAEPVLAVELTAVLETDPDASPGARAGLDERLPGAAQLREEPRAHGLRPRRARRGWERSCDRRHGRLG